MPVFFFFLPAFFGECEMSFGSPKTPSSPNHLILTSLHSIIELQKTGNMRPLSHELMLPHTHVVSPLELHLHLIPCYLFQ